MKHKTVLAIVAAIPLALAFMSLTARFKANALCSSVSLGQDQASAQSTLASAAPNFSSYRPENQSYSAAYTGAFIDLWYCKVRFSGGRLTEKRVEVMY